MNTYTPLLVFLLHQFLTEGTEICKSFKNDLKVVPSCPTSKEEWDRAANKKNCTELANRRNCTNTKNQLQYHCVINAYMNETLEICAEPRYIFGHCTEFNVIGEVIQSNYATKCNNDFPKCGGIYISENAYKYQDCYQLVYQRRATKTTVLPQESNISNQTEHNEKNREKTITVVIFPVVAVTSIGCLFYFFFLILDVKRWGKKDTIIDENKDYGEVETVHDAETKPSVVYLYLQPKHFPRFNDIYNRSMDYIFQFEEQTMEQENEKTLDVIIKVGVVGKFTDDNFKLLPEGKRNLSGRTHIHIWDAVPLLCFQNDLSFHSALKTLRTESACHKILIKSNETIRSATDEVDDSITIISQNKKQIKEGITFCLIQPICQMENRWCKYLEAEHSIILTSGIIDKLQVMLKKMEFENSKETVALLNGSL